MDRPLILKGTVEQVQIDLDIINQIAAAWWAAQGYTVIDTPEGKAVVGKNAATGEDNDKALTTTWAIPQPLDPENEDGEWFIPSPSTDPRFVNWRDYIPQGVEILCREEELEQAAG